MQINLKNLILEGVVEKAAENFLKDTIKGTEWENKIYAVGGYVRDELSGTDPKDLDILVDKPYGGIEFGNWLTKKIGNYKEGSNPVIASKFGTAKISLKGVKYNGIDLSKFEIEAVMPRAEKYEPGSRKPEVVPTTLRGDAERRDINFNAIFKNISTGEILDLTGKGVSDLKNKIIRTPLDPDKTFIDDPLRMLRVVRFYAKYKYDIPLYLIKSMKKNAAQLANISSERIRDELDKMLLTGSPQKAIKLLKITGLLSYVIPELVPAIKMTQNKHHKHDVFDHTLDVLSKTQPVLIQRLMGLFHDIGKTVTKSVTPTGVHFYGHEYAGEKIADQVMRRLKYPVELIDAVKTGVKNHMRLKNAGDTGVELSDKALRKFKIDVGDKLEDVLGVIHADNIAHSEASSMPNQINNIRKRLDSLNMNVVSGKPKLPITGEDLKQLGIKPGPIFSDIIKAVTEAWYENPNISKKEAIQIVKKII